MTDYFGGPDADIDPRGFLPTAPGLDALLEGERWRDASLPEQSSVRTLSYTGWGEADSGTVVLVFRDDLVDIIARRGGASPAVEQDVLQPAEVTGWLERWAENA
ncbi:hypothetical protein GMYAFLOJ_CDS0066 [Microbacterium phage phiMiGM15]